MILAGCFIATQGFLFFRRKPEGAIEMETIASNLSGGKEQTFQPVDTRINDETDPLLDGAIRRSPTGDRFEVFEV